MTEQEVLERERKAFAEGARWGSVQMFHLKGPEEDAEASRRYPEIDVQQGPSGRWYRLRGEWNELRGYQGEQLARHDTSIGSTVGILPGDEAAVAELLQRHAARRGGA